jgi:hypothetical protein
VLLTVEFQRKHALCDGALLVLDHMSAYYTPTSRQILLKKDILEVSMCGGPEHPKATSVCDTTTTSLQEKDNDVAVVDKKSCKIKVVGKIYSILLELAAENDLLGFQQAANENVLNIYEASFWYGRKHGTSQMVLEQRTPVMIAALFGSVDVLNYILSTYATHGLDINSGCGSDNSTALHCAAAGGSAHVVETVKLLIQSGADANSLDAFGRRPADVIIVSPKLAHARSILEEMLNVAVGALLNSSIKFSSIMSDSSFHLPEFVQEEPTNSCGGEYNSSQSVSPFTSPPLSSSPETSYTTSPSLSPNSIELSKSSCDNNDKKEYPVDPSLPDIKNSIYSTDEFRMFSFKVRPCSRAYSHDWTECPFVHPGENARRRDPRRFHYSCVPCPEFRKGTCRRNDSCEYAHGVFESWLHPAQYRTRLCKDGTNCARRVCFFAHKPEELRPLYLSTGSAVPSPRITASMDMASLAPGSPSSVLMMSPFSPTNPSKNTLFTPPMSPSSPKSGHSSLAGAWSQSSLPMLHLPGGGSQTSRLRATLSARDLPLDDLIRGSDNDGQIIDDFSPLSNQARMNATLAAALSGDGSTSGKYVSYGLNSVTPVNLEDLFSSEMSLQGVADSEPPVLSHMGTQMSTNNSMQGHSHLQNQKQLSISTQLLQATTQMQQAATDPQSPGHSFLQSSVLSPSYSLASLGRMSSFSGDFQCHKSNESLLSPVMSPTINSRVTAFSHQDRRSYSSRDLGAHLPPTSSDWGSPTGKLDWGVQGEELSKFRKSLSFGYRNSNELDSTWIQSMVKEAPKDVQDASLDYSMETSINGNIENSDHAVLASWMDEMHLD